MNTEGIIGKPESIKLAYKAVLPPARSLAQMMASLANTEGGFIILGVHVANGEIAVVGLSDDFQANSVTHKAIDYLNPKPDIQYTYIANQQKRLYAIKVEKADSDVSIEGKIYIREKSKIILKNPDVRISKKNATPSITKLLEEITNAQNSVTGSKAKFIDHFLSVINIVEDVIVILYPETEIKPTEKSDGKVLMRILFSSCADNFEIYLTNLLYEIYLANPSTLKSSHEVTVKEVLDCADMEEFVLYWAKKKLNKLQRGSVKGFIAENNQIKSLNVISSTDEDSLEKILQIRHLYSHRNGIVDEKFLQFFPGQFSINDEHQLSLSDMLKEFSFLVHMVDKIDRASIVKYHLATPS